MRAISTLPLVLAFAPLFAQVEDPRRVAAETELEGVLEATVDDDFVNHRSVTRWRLRTATETIDLDFSSGTPTDICGSRIRVAGTRNGARMAVRGFAASDAQPELTFSQCSVTTSARKVAVLLLRTPAVALPSNVDATAIANALFGPGQSLDRYWNEASYGRVTATGSVFGPFTLDAEYDCSQNEAILSAAIRAAESSVDFTQYHHIALVFPGGSSCSLGLGSIGCRSLNSTVRGRFSTGVSWLRASALNRNDRMISIFGHEFGHNLGLDHATTLTFPNVPLGDLSTGVFDEYGDYLSMMGLSFSFNGATLLGHLAAPHKSQLGWLTAANIQTVETSGTYTIAPYESPTAGAQVLKIRRGTTNGYLWAEYRRNAGFNATTASLVPSFDGAWIHYSDPLLSYASTYTNLLNFHPGTEVEQSLLRVGESWQDPATSLRISVNTATAAGLTLTVNTQPPAGLLFVPVTPCRVADTRNATGTFGGPVLAALSTRDFPIPSSSCGIPAGAQAYSLNVTVVPRGSLGYLSIWPTGVAQPVVSTLNALDGRIKANAAIVPAGTNGGVSVFVTDTSDVILAITGYFISSDPNGLAFYPVTPCRVSDTRNAAGTLGGPFLAARTARTIPVRSSACGIPATAKAYSMNATVVPKRTLGFLTMWPSGSTQPLVSTLNATTGTVVANAAILPASSTGAIDVYATDDSELILDINGYFAPPGSTGELKFYGLTPCRISDTRLAAGTFGGPAQAGQASRDYPVPTSACSVPATAKAYSLNATVVPPAAFGFLTLWPAGGTRPTVSTLNAVDGAITSNAAIVPAGSTSGAISAYGSELFHLLLDINGYFAP